MSDEVCEWCGRHWRRSTYVDGYRVDECYEAPRGKLLFLESINPRVSLTRRERVFVGVGDAVSDAAVRRALSNHAMMSLLDGQEEG